MCLCLQLMKWHNSCNILFWFKPNVNLTTGLVLYKLIDGFIFLQVLVLSWHQAGPIGVEGETQPSSVGLPHMETAPTRESAAKHVQQWKPEGEYTVAVYMICDGRKPPTLSPGR